ncbi:MAG: PEP-CTERM sorting domain-containing protein [Nostoc sp. DedVER02]|uniref:PEP-CTERM sorting domain-containing protein n=1 Tax=unclassified Nostoc TaxID=2593658 RepID=UPI002AD59D79|nr:MULTISPECIES: PEP-CTERM sorting domain-containing protein [unclassified Nostoc]MDZ7986135.1 PEP-CTERM sorting domain-containing protein [Nostoc sp. DedVER02]MDZ8112798.1 PEP-CTERM sorting domain-containing protein [Nostoc sp. DedVER01b]
MKNINKLALVTIGSLGLSLGIVANAQQANASGLINGGFEDTVVRSDLSWDSIDASLIPGWETTATDNKIEIQTPRLFHAGALGTNQYAELNANEVSTLYQDVDTTAGSTMFWRFFHEGRQGVDTMRLSIIDLATNNTLFSQLYSTDNTAWVEYQGTTIATGGKTRWQFDSVSAAGGNPSIGNFLDEVYFAEKPPEGFKTVPEPASVLGLLAMGAFGIVSTRKRKQLNIGN